MKDAEFTYSIHHLFTDLGAQYMHAVGRCNFLSMLHIAIECTSKYSSPTHS